MKKPLKSEGKAEAGPDIGNFPMILRRDGNPPSRVMGKKTLAKKILSLHRQGEALNIDEVRRNHPDLLAAAYCFRPFLGWKQALELAGLDYKSIRTSLETYLVCGVCGGYYKNLGSHVIRHGYESTAEYRAEFPTPYLLSEDVRAAQSFTGKAKVPHWERVLSWEYVLDRVWFWYSRHGRCNLDFILDNDPSLAGFAGARGVCWDEIIRAVDLDPGTERLRKQYPIFQREEILSILRDHDQQRLRNPEVIQRNDHRLRYSILKEFGKVSVARREAGLPPASVRVEALIARKKYPGKQSILAALNSHVQAGGLLLKTEIQRLDPALITAITREYDGFTKCVGKHPGLKKHYETSRSIVSKRAFEGAVRKPKGKYPSAERVVEELRERHRRGLSLFQSHVILDDPRLKNGIYAHCGTWKNAIRMAGLEEAQRIQRAAVVRKDAVYTSAGQVVAELKRLAGEGCHISQDEIVRRDRPLKGAAYRYLGSWKAAIEAAGLTRIAAAQHRQALVRRGSFPTPESVIEELKRRTSGGRVFVPKQEIRSENVLRGAAYRHFGTWRKALEAAGLTRLYQQLNPRSVPRYTDADSVVKALKSRKKKGLSLSVNVVQREDSSLKGSAWRFFGSWSAALAAAGLGRK